MSESFDRLIHSHSEFEAGLREFTDAVERDAWLEAEDAFWQLVAELKVHMAMEEEVLYPAYERDRDLPPQPVHALRAEHDVIVGIRRRVRLF